MTSVIVFSMNRPMQINAFIESILFFSNITEESINVIYKETEGISYEKVMSKYIRVHWMKQKNFQEDLRVCMSDGTLWEV